MVQLLPRRSTPKKGSKRLAKLKSVHQLGKEKDTQPLPENTII